MSTRVYNRDSRNKYVTDKSVKKFCGVCQKAGLTEKDYTSHFTKSSPGPTGTVICPTILNNECTFCFKTDHFKSACPALVERERLHKKQVCEEKRQYFKQHRAANEKKTVSLNRGVFSVLDNYDEDFDISSSVLLKRSYSVANEIKEEWPTLSTVASNPRVNTPNTDKPSFASIAANPLPVKKTEQVFNTSGFTVITKNGIQHPQLSPTPTKPTKHTEFKSKSWADYTDSDTDNDDYDDNTAW